MANNKTLFPLFCARNPLIYIILCFLVYVCIKVSVVPHQKESERERAFPNDPIHPSKNTPIHSCLRQQQQQLPYLPAEASFYIIATGVDRWWWREEKEEEWGWTHDYDAHHCEGRTDSAVAQAGVARKSLHLFTHPSTPPLGNYIDTRVTRFYSSTR